MPRHLMKRGDIYYYRRNARPLAPVSSANLRITFSLKAHVPAVARFRAAVADKGFERMTALLHSDPTAWSLDERTLNEAVSAVVQTALADAEQERVLSGEISPFEVQRAVRHWQSEAQRLSASLARRSPDAAQPFIERLISAGLLPAQLDSASYARAAREVTKGLIRAAEENARREAGVYDATGGITSAPVSFTSPAVTPLIDSFANQTPAPSGRVHEATSATALPNGAGIPNMAPAQGTDRPSASPASEPKDDHDPTIRPRAGGETGTLSEQIEARAALPISQAMEKALARSTLSEPTKKNYLSSAKLFIGFFGDIPVSEVTDDMALDFRSWLLDLPAKYSRDPRFMSLPLPDMIEAADEIDEQLRAKLTGRQKHGELTEFEYEAALDEGLVQRMTKKTICKHLSAMNIIWTKLINAGATGGRQRINPFGGLIYSESERNKDRRKKRGFDRSELHQIFTSSAFRKEMASAPEDRSREFWITVCIAFSGARREEIAQLRLENVKLADSVPHFSFQDGKQQSLKTSNAARDVPIHPFLMHLGFHAYVEKRIASGSVWLFPGAGDIGVGHRSKTAAQWFGRIVRELGLYEEGSCLHRLRKSVSTELADAFTETAYIGDLLGHTREGTTAKHYIGESTLEKKAELIEHVTFGLTPTEPGWLVPSASVERRDGNVLHLNQSGVRRT